MSVVGNVTCDHMLAIKAAENLEVLVFVLVYNQALHAFGPLYISLHSL